MKSDFTFEENDNVTSITFKNLKEDGSTKNHITVTVKNEFFNNIDWEKISNTMDLFRFTDVQNHLHNENGPAVIDHTTNNHTWFLNGNLIDSETKEKM